MNHYLKNTLYFLILLQLSACAELPRMVFKNIPDINDYTIFPVDTISKSKKTFYFPKAKKITPLPNHKEWIVTKKYEKIRKIYLNTLNNEQFFELSNTTAFIVIKNDSIVYEKYFNGYDENDVIQNFSVTKVLLSTLSNIAHTQGYFKNLNEPIATYIPELKDNELGKITIEQCYQMNTGLKSDFKNPFRTMAFYYTKNPDKFLKKFKLSYDPGSKFQYSSFSSYLLGLCLEKATGLSIAEYAEKTIWKPIGCEFDAGITMHENGRPKAYCGLVAHARDLAKLGKLYLNQGYWGDEKILDQKWITDCYLPDTSYGRWWGYSNGFWLSTFCNLTDSQLQTNERFINHSENINCCREMCASGFNGQELFINPEKNIIIIRQGKRKHGINWILSVSRLAQYI